jgi:hypothetical protein
MKWLSYNTTEQLVNTLLAQINDPGPLLKTPPSAMFTSKIQTHHSPKEGGARLNQMTPPRSPGGEKYFGRTMSPQSSGPLLDLTKTSLHDDFSAATQE